jgi:hypothetical protein
MRRFWDSSNAGQVFNVCRTDYKLLTLKRFTSSSRNRTYIGAMTNSPEGQISPTTANASVFREPESNVAIRWFVPPIVVPAFLILLIVARAGYSAFFWS